MGHDVLILGLIEEDCDDGFAVEIGGGFDVHKIRRYARGGARPVINWHPAA